MTDDVLKANPFRYRGYYYDSETGLYYLNSRYYDPEIGRFILPDGISYLEPEKLGGLNLYAYCNNNPVMFSEPSGHFVISTAIAIGIAIGVAVGATVGGVVAYNVAQNRGSEGWELFAWTVLGILGGGIIGAALGAGIGYIAPQIGGALSAFAAKEFTFGSGAYITARGGLAMSAGLTITGAQILLGAGILTGTIIMASIIGKSGSYTVKKFSEEHDPPHVHIYGDDIADKLHGIRIGLDGNPLPGQGKLPPGARKALKKLWKIILKKLLE